VSSILGAFTEKIFKRFFVYSSMGHVGFMLIGISVLNVEGLKSTFDYLVIYIISSFII
jgi:NADH:ubiquinone oxidoreductase subunit 2 (subunit N)